MSATGLRVISEASGVLDATESDHARETIRLRVHTHTSLGAGWAESPYRAGSGLNSSMTSSAWQNLVIETQFATELILTGLRRLCAVPTEPDLTPWSTKDMNYALHVGMYSYSSGLERLCKLAIACNGYARNGVFPNLKNYSHRIGQLLDAVEQLPSAGVVVSERRSQWLVRPSDPLGPELMTMVERFANGAGRYEHLDSLYKEGAEVSTYAQWSALAAKASVSEDVRRLLALKYAVADVVESEMIELKLEATTSHLVEDLERPIFEPSVGVVLSLFRTVRWVSTILDESTNQTSADLPIVGEIVVPAFAHPSSAFFNYNIARFSDDMVIEEEIGEAYQRIRSRGSDDDEDNDVEGTES